MKAFFEMTNEFNFQIIDSLIESRGVRLTWQTVIQDAIYTGNRVTIPTSVAPHFDKSKAGSGDSLA